MAPIIALSLARLHAPHVAALSTCIALVIHLHRSPRIERVERRAIWLALASLPVGTIAIDVIGSSIGVLAGVLAFQVPVGVSAQGIGDLVRAGDVGYGFGHACVYGVVLGAVGSIGFPLIAKRARWRLFLKIALVWAVAGASCAVVDGVWEVISPVDEASEDALNSLIVRATPRLQRFGAFRGPSANLHARGSSIRSAETAPALTPLAG